MLITNNSGIKPEMGGYASITIPSSSVSINESKLLDSRRNIALSVEKKINADGIKSKKIITAILVNMWHESRWNPKAKSGSCVGLFQLHTKYAGRGMNIKQLTNVNDHVHKLLSLTDYKKWKLWAIKNENKVSCGELAYQFASKVERCASPHRAPRRVTADRWWRKTNNKTI